MPDLAALWFRRVVSNHQSVLHVLLISYSNQLCRRHGSRQCFRL